MPHYINTGKPTQDAAPSNLSSRKEWLDYVDRNFGSDDALGILTHVVNNDGSEGPGLTLDELNAQYPDNQRTTPGGITVETRFADGSSGTECTAYARHIAAKLPGRVVVMGFANEDNPTARAAREQFHPGGHDFAVVDGRWLIDPWVRLVASESNQIAYDLTDPTDAATVLDTYGPVGCWSVIQDAEEADEQQTESPRA